MSDLISRQAAIDAIRASTSKYTGLMEMEMYTDDDAVEAIEGVPPAQPERKKGRWVPHIEKSREYIGTVLVNVTYDYWLCDTCGYRVENGQPTYNFCPNCGAEQI